MNKKKLAIAGMLGFTFLFGCSQIDKPVSADVSKGFAIVHDDDFEDLYVDVVEIRHIKTGCHYMYVAGNNEGGLTQMYNADGLPYCD